MKPLKSMHAIPVLDLAPLRLHGVRAGASDEPKSRIYNVVASSTLDAVNWDGTSIAVLSSRVCEIESSVGESIICALRDRCVPTIRSTTGCRVLRRNRGVGGPFLPSSSQTGTMHCVH